MRSLCIPEVLETPSLKNKTKSKEGNTDSVKTMFDPVVYNKITGVSKNSPKMVKKLKESVKVPYSPWWLKVNDEWKRGTERPIGNKMIPKMFFLRQVVSHPLLSVGTSRCWIDL
jgi:hypothetical protein